MDHDTISVIQVLTNLVKRFKNANILEQMYTVTAEEIDVPFNKQKK